MVCSTVWSVVVYGTYMRTYPSLLQFPRQVLEVFGIGAKYGVDSSETLFIHSIMGYRDKTAPWNYPLW